MDTVTARGTRHSEARPAFRADHERPRHSFLELPPIAAAVPHARRHTRSVLAEWDFEGIADTAELLVSELVTNGDAPRGALLYPRCSREELKGGSWA